MEPTWTVKYDTYYALYRAIEADNVEFLSRSDDALQYLNSPVLIEDDDDNWDHNPLIGLANVLGSTKCLEWMLQHGGNPNLRHKQWTLLGLCFSSLRDHHELLIYYGAKLELTELEWETFGLWSQTASNSNYRDIAKKALLRGVALPEKNRGIPRVFYEAYEVILAREAACRRACYAVLLYFPLPKDISRWLVRTFVFPSRRESYWSELKMPKDFE